MNWLKKARSWFSRKPAKEAVDLGFGVVPDPGLANNNWFRQWVGMYQLVDRMARARGGTAVERPLDDRMLYIARGLMRYNSYAQGYVSALRTHTLGARGLQHLPTGPSAKKLKSWLDWWKKEVDWWSWEREIYERVHIEGESITRFFPDSGCVLLRPIEPEWIVAPNGETEWMFGFYNEPGDVHEVTALNTLTDGKNELVEHDEWYHIKSKVSVRADKRGRSDFLPAAPILDDSFKTWKNFAQSEAVRQAIIYFSEAADGVSISDIEQSIAAETDYAAPVVSGKRGGDPIKLTYGSGVEHLPPGTKLNSVPMAAIQSTVSGINAAMLAVGRQYHMPLVLITGDMGANNTLDFGDESPFGMSVGDEQNWYGRHIRQLLWRVVEVAVDEGYLDEDVLYDGTDIEVSAERKPARDMDKNTNRAKTLAEDGIISKRERSTLEGVDYDEQQQQIVKERESQAVVDVVGTALNGAQVSSLLEITDKVAAKQYPPEAAAALISTAFPLLSAQVVERIVAAIGKFKPPSAEPAPAAPAFEDVSGLVEKEVTVHRGGKTFQEKRRVKSKEHKLEKGDTVTVAGVAHTVIDPGGEHTGHTVKVKSGGKTSWVAKHDLDKHESAEAAPAGMLSTEDVFGKKQEALPSTPAAKKAGEELEAGEGQAATVNLDELTPTQDYVGADKVKGIASDYDDEQAVVQLIHYGDKLLIYDGHHTAAAAKKAGKKTVKAKIIRVPVESTEDTTLVEKDVTVHRGGKTFVEKRKVKSGSGEPAAKTKVGETVSPEQHKAAVHKALAKFKSVPQPTKQELREAKKGLRKLGANKYRKNLVGNSKDRAKRRQALYQEFGDGTMCPCIYCGIAVGEGTLEQDKILTTAQGGRYRMPNLIPSCSGCNKARSDTPFAEVAKVLEEQHGAAS